MPEGPEIRRAADRVAKVLLDRPLTDVAFAADAFPHLQDAADALIGQSVTRIDTRGKAMLMRFSGGLTMYSHNQLYGRWVTAAINEIPLSTRALRVTLGTATHRALLYSASDVALLDEVALSTHPFLARLGPDILDQHLTAGQIVERASSRAFRNRNFVALLLDQNFLAGVGNYLRSEILFAAGINPWSTPKQLTAKQLMAIARQALHTSQRSYRTGGVTNPARRVAEIRRQLRQSGEPHTLENYRFAVFRREAAPCYACRRPIRKVRAASRPLFYCATCQNVDT
ncbi:MAG TPA: endonuclease VIII [Woeseiaceae bacterium]|nr:endonuclease VIII [Woeseiaceae bacterium]